MADSTAHEAMVTHEFADQRRDLFHEQTRDQTLLRLSMIYRCDQFHSAIPLPALLQLLAIATPKQRQTWSVKPDLHFPANRCGSYPSDIRLPTRRHQSLQNRLHEAVDSSDDDAVVLH